MSAIARCIERPAGTLCQACINGEYPTPCGRRLYQRALADAQVVMEGDIDASTLGRIVEGPLVTAVRT